MKTICAAVAVGFLGAFMSVAQSAFDENDYIRDQIVGRAQIFTPANDDTYDNGFGGELQFRHWMSDVVGVAGVVGVASWQVKEESAGVSSPAAIVTAKIDGDVTLVPVGGAILLRPINDSRLAIILAGGLRYVFVDSNAEIESSVMDRTGQYRSKDTVDLDNGLVGAVEVEGEYKFQTGLSLLAAIGYQFDLDKGDATLVGEDFGDNELEALVISFGIGAGF